MPIELRSVAKRLREGLSGVVGGITNGIAEDRPGSGI